MPVPAPTGRDALSAEPVDHHGPTLHQIYEAHWEFVWRALRACGVSDAELEDQTHEVFLVVHRRLADFEGRSRITTWLFSIAQNVASGWRRRAYVRRERPTAEVPEPHDPGQQPDRPDADLERRQARDALHELLDELPEDQRVVFVLYEVDNLPVDEIAVIVGAPVNTVYSRLRLARACFKRSLARRQARGVL